jgi:hypothetical protein
MGAHAKAPRTHAAWVRICMYCRRICLGTAEDGEVWAEPGSQEVLPEDLLTHGLCRECLEAHLEPQIQELIHLRADRAAAGGEQA